MPSTSTSDWVGLGAAFLTMRGSIHDVHRRVNDKDRTRPNLLAKKSPAGLRRRGQLRTNFKMGPIRARFPGTGDSSALAQRLVKAVLPFLPGDVLVVDQAEFRSGGKRGMDLAADQSFMHPAAPANFLAVAPDAALRIGEIDPALRIHMPAPFADMLGRK